MTGVELVQILTTDLVAITRGRSVPADDEAAVRICPLPASAADPARSFNLEFRAADATANPYLVLGAMVRAGLSGLRDRLPQPPPVNTDPADLPRAELDRLGVTRPPDSLPAALAADEQVQGWFAPAFLEAFRGVKAREIDFAGGVTSEALCERYRAICWRRVG